MDDSFQATLRNVWRRQSARNGWKLVDDEERFLDTARVEAVFLACAEAALKCLQQAVLRAYSLLLHQGLRARRDQAAAELYRALHYTALSRGRSPTDAEEYAQEAFFRVLEKLPTLREPRSLLAWAFRILSTVAQDRAAQTARTAEPLDNETAEQIADPLDLEAGLIEGLIGAELLRRIQQLIPNSLERVAVLDDMMRGAKPGDTATVLGISQTHARTAKYRGLQRLRKNAEFMRFLSELTDSSTGGS